MSNEVYRKGVVGTRKIDLRPILDKQDDEYLEKSRKAIYLYLPKIIFEDY